jgi:hypothetical protein
LRYSRRRRRHRKIGDGSASRGVAGGARLISIVHDEFIVECLQEQAEDVRLLMIETMQTAPEGFVAPMVVEAEIAANWGDAKWRRPTDQKCPCGAAAQIRKSNAPCSGGARTRKFQEQPIVEKSNSVIGE